MTMSARQGSVLCVGLHDHDLEDVVKFLPNCRILHSADIAASRLNDLTAAVVRVGDRDSLEMSLLTKIRTADDRALPIVVLTDHLNANCIAQYRQQLWKRVGFIAGGERFTLEQRRRHFHAAFATAAATDFANPRVRCEFESRLWTLVVAGACWELSVNRVAAHFKMSVRTLRNRTEGASLGSPLQWIRIGQLMYVAYSLDRLPLSIGEVVNSCGPFQVRTFRRWARQLLYCRLSQLTPQQVLGRFER
jgi:AraC-like DNA-binding protein